MIQNSCLWFPMSERYQRPDYIRVVKAVCVEFGNNDDTWTWCYLDVREALTKAEDLLMKLEPDERGLLSALPVAARI